MKRVNIILLLLLPCILFAQKQGQQRYDSLSTILPSLKDDTTKVLVLLDMAELQQNLHRDKGISIAYRAIQLSRTLNWDKGLALSYKRLGHNYYKIGKRDSSHIFFNRAVEVFESIGDKYSLAKTYSMQAQMYKDLNNYRKSKEYCFKALKLFTEINDSLGMAGFLGNIGDLISEEGRYDEAMKYHFQALDIYEKVGNKQGQANNLLCIGHLYLVQDDSKEALKCFQRALRLEQEIGRQTGISHNLNNIGVIFSSKGQYDSAITYFRKALKINKEQKDNKEYANGLIKIALINIERGHFGIAKIQLNEALEISEKYDFQDFKTYSFLHLAELHIELGNYSKNSADKMKYYNLALKFGLDAKKIAERMNLVDDLIPIYFTVSKTYELLGNKDKALKYYKAYSEIKDSVFNKQRSDRILELMKRYESDLKERDIDHLKELNKQESEKSVQFIWTSAIVVLLLIIILSVLYLRYRLKVKTNKELDKLNSTKNKLFSIISHDLQGSVSSNSKLSDILANNFDKMSESDKKENIKVMQKSSRQVSNLVENLLQWSRLQSNGIKPLLVKIEIKGIIKEIISSYSEITKTKQILIAESVNSDVAVFADEEMLKTILRNIIGNAIKFTNPDGKIEIYSENSGSKIKLIIKDNGVGFKKEDLEKVFRMDVKHSTLGTSNEKGTGLGLMISKELVELNDGNISIISKKDIGTEVIVELPKYRD